MLFFIIIGLISTLIAAMYKNTRYALELAFILFTFFFAIRYDFGADYDPYLTHFGIANDAFDFEDALNTTSFEPGWVFLYRLFKPIGFFGMVIVLTILENLVLYKMIKKYVPVQWQWLAVFSYIMTSSLCLTGLSMMRQFLAMCLCMLAIDLALKKKKNFIWALLLVLLSTQFHTSATICYPFCFIGFIKDIKLHRVVAFSLGILLIVGGFLLADFLGEYLQLFIKTSAFEKYESNFGEQYTTRFGLSTVVSYIIVFVILLMQQKQNRELRILYCFFVLYLIIDAFTPVAPLLGRMGLYFFIWLPICWPTAIDSLNKSQKEIVVLFLLIFIVFRIYGIVSFVTSPGWGNYFLEYHTIFSAPKWY